MDSTLLRQMSDIAVRAGSLVRRRREKLTAADVSLKCSATDVVTTADRESEAFLREELGRAFPDVSFYGEEGEYEPLSSLERVFIVDPIDGTANYLHGYPFYCVSIGLRERGVTTAGVVYVPALDDLYVAERGGGAFKNGRRLHVSGVDSLLGANVATGFACVRAHLKPDNVGLSARMIPQVQGFRRSGSAAIDLCHLAEGCVDAFWELLLKPWDYEAGRLIAREAGATVTGFDGGEVQDELGQIVATNGLLHRLMLENIAGYLYNEKPSASSVSQKK